MSKLFTSLILVFRLESVRRYSLVFLVFPLSLCTRTPVTYGQQRLDERQEAVVERLIIRGMTRLYLEDYTGATEAFEEALRIKPDDAALLASMSQARLAGGETGSAEFFIERAIENEPTNPEVWRVAVDVYSAANDMESVLASRRQLVVHDRSNVNVHLELTSLLMRLERYDEALASVTSAIETLGASGVFIRLKADLLERLGRTSDLEAALVQLVELNPLDPECRMRLAASFIRREAWADAESVLSDLMNVFPGYEEASITLVDVLDRMGRTEEAAALRVLLASDSESVDADDRPATELSDRRTVEELLIRLEAQPDDYDAAMELAGRLAENGSFTDAALYYRRVATGEPRRIDAWTAGISAYLDAGDYDQSMKMIEEAEIFYPGYVPIRLLKADLLVRTNRIEEALEIVRELREKPLSEDQAQILERLLQQMESM